MRQIDLSGPGGSAFSLLGMAKRIARQMGIDPKPIMDDMQSGDYNHLIEVFEREFPIFEFVRSSDDGDE